MTIYISCWFGLVWLRGCRRVICLEQSEEQDAHSSRSFSLVSAINGNEQSRGIVFSTDLPRFPVLALPLVLLPLVGSVMYPDSIGIKECLAAFAVCGVGDFVIKRYYVDHALKRLTSGY